MTRLTLSLAAALGLALGSAPAQAREPGNVRVSYSDLDLGNPNGVRVLNGRVRAAARQLCAFHLTGFGAWGQADYVACVAAAVDGVQSQLDALVARATRERLARRSGDRIAGR